MNTTLKSLLVLATASPVLLADINTGAPATPTPQTPTRVQGNCDLLASNTLRATFVGLRDLQVQTFDQETPSTVQVAVFEVIENLAYRRYVRYGDGRLKPGTRFTVTLSRDLPGQPSSVVDTIGQMQPGEEAVMKIDHLYLFGDQEGKPIRPCSRMARRQDAGQQATEAGAQPKPVTSGYSRQVSVSINGNGTMQSSEVIQQKLPGSDEVKTRVFVNGQEVDPTTRQPLNNTQPAPAPAASQPESEKPASGGGSDTIVEHVPQNAAPAPAPTPAAPANSKPASSNEGF